MHTKTNLLIHLIWGMASRSHGLDESVYRYVAGVVRNSKAFPIVVGGYTDHIHLLIRIRPSHSISDLVRTIKVATSKRIDDPKFRWQEGFGAYTVSPSDAERVRQYIIGQAEHHRPYPGTPPPYDPAT